MKLFKKIAKAAGGHAKQDKADAAAAAAASKLIAPAQPTAAAAAAAKLIAPVQPAAAKEASAAGPSKPAVTKNIVCPDDEARMRAKFDAISKEREELKQRNAFLLQMLAVSQLDEKQLESEIQQHLALPQTSCVSSEASPIHKRF